MMPTSSFIPAAVALLLLTACGGGGSSAPSSSGGNNGDSTPPPPPPPAVIDTGAASIGVFTDSAVRGVTYLSQPSGLSGTTGNNGEFSYQPGDSVTFTLAGHALPAVTARGRISPAILATELAGSGSSAADIGNLTLNLAILLQALDDNGNPEDGIQVRSNTDLSDLLAGNTALSGDPVNFAADLSAADNSLVVPNPVSAAKHYYRNELTGNWQLNRIEHADDDHLQPSEQFNIFVSFDASARLLWVEYATTDNPATCSPFESGYSAIYTGRAEFSDETAGLITMVSNGRTLLDGCPPGSTDHIADMFGASISIVGDQLVISRSESHKAYFDRLPNHKNAVSGFWAEADGLVTRNADGTLKFGDDIDGLFSYVTGEQWISVVLDRNAAGENCEFNGVYVTDYTFDNDAQRVTFGNAQLNHIWENPASCGKTLPVSTDFGASRQNDTLLPVLFDGEEDAVQMRNLSQEDAATLFRQYSAAQVQSTLTGSWLIDAETEPGSRLAVLTILADGRYILGINHLDPACSDGVEYGQYSMGANEDLTFIADSVILDSTGPGGDCGLYENGSGSLLSLQIDSANRFRLVLSGETDRILLNRIPDSGLSGSWLTANDELAVITFLPGGTYMVAQAVDGDDAEDSLTGLETGRYTLSNSGELTVTQVLLDTNGTSGLSDLLVSNQSLTLMVNAEDQLTIAGDDGFIAWRAAAVTPLP